MSNKQITSSSVNILPGITDGADRALELGGQSNRRTLQDLCATNAALESKGKAMADKKEPTSLIATPELGVQAGQENRQTIQNLLKTRETPRPSKEEKK